MTPERWHRVQEVLGRALAVPTNDRPRLVADVCADDRELQSEVDSLLAQISAASDFFSTAEASTCELPPPRASLVGRRLGPYTIKSQLGSGGMGLVYLAEDTRLHRLVAVKALREDAASTPEGRERLLREARAVAALNHPHIAAIYDVLESGDDPPTPPCIVMEYVDGETLSDRIRRGALALDDALRIGSEIAMALAAAHRQGVIHRDLKPANLLLTIDGHVKVLDFGLARRMAASAEATTTTIERSVPAAPRGVAGTPGYMSPEQALGHAAAPASDIFSLGIVLFQMIAGRRPFAGDDFLSAAVAMMASPSPRLSAVVPDVPPVVDTLVGRMLEKEPYDRPTADDVVAELGRAQRNEIGTSSDRGATPSRHPITRRVVAAALGLGGILSIVLASDPLRHALGIGAGGPASPIVLAVMPVDAPPNTAAAESLGVGIAAVVAGNFASIPHVSVLSRAAAAAYAKNDDRFATLQHALGATHVLQLSWRSGDGALRLRARVRVPGAAEPVWDKTFEGDSLTIERDVLDGITQTLERQRGRRFTSDERHRLRMLPTTNAKALSAYADGMAQLDRIAIDQAIASLQRAVALDSQFVYAWAWLGEAFWRKYLVDKDATLVAKAGDALRHAEALDPDNATVHYAMGYMQYRTGETAQAEASLRRALTLQPDYDAAQRELAQVLAGSGRVDEAEALMQQAIRFSKNWNNYFMLGTIDYRAGRYEAAAAAFKGAADANPAVAGPFIMLGNTQYILGDLQRAVGNFEHAIRLGPAPAAYANLALAYYDQGRFDEALGSYEEAIRRDPKNAEFHRDVGDVHARLGRTDAARAEYERAIALENNVLAINPRDVRAMTFLALCEAKLGRSVDAERHAAEAIAVDPSTPEVWQRSAEVHALLSQRDAALRDLTIAVARGFEPRMARRDEELASIKKLPRFDEILRAAPGNARSTRGATP